MIVWNLPLVWVLLVEYYVKNKGNILCITGIFAQKASCIIPQLPNPLWNEMNEGLYIYNILINVLHEYYRVNAASGKASKVQ